MQVNIPDIYIPPNRQRQKVNESRVAELAISIQQDGLLHPIVVAPLDRVRFPDVPAHLKYQLVSGYRRLIATASLKVTEIAVNLRENLSPLQLKEIELNENLQREDLPFQDEVRAKAEMYELRKELYGDGFRELAQHLNESRGEVWEDVQLAKAIESHPELAKAKNKTQANNKLRLLRRRDRLEQDAVDRESTGLVTDFDHKIFLGDCLVITSDWNDGCCQLVLTDPPYGINLDKGETKKGNPHPEVYEDDTYDILDLTARAAKLAFRLLAPNTHAYFWFDIKAHAKVLRILQDAGFTVDPIPLLWIKPGPGQVNHPDSRWGSGYEACFFCRKGNRALLKQGQSNILAYDPVPPAKKIHPTEKPTALLRQLIETSTAPSETVVDLFGGSGSTAEAAIQTGRNFLLCEKDPSYHEGILQRLGNLEGPNTFQKGEFDPLAGEEEDE